MNKERLALLINHIDTLPDYDVGEDSDSFDMSSFYEYSECGTVACIGGWALHLFSTAKSLANVINLYGYVGNLLDISENEREALLFPFNINLDIVKREDALKTLRHYYETGDVVWDVLTDDGEKPASYINGVYTEAED